MRQGFFVSGVSGMSKSLTSKNAFLDACFSSIYFPSERLLLWFVGGFVLKESPTTYHSLCLRVCKSEQRRFKSSWRVALAISTATGLVLGEGNASKNTKELHQSRNLRWNASEANATVFQLLLTVSFQMKAWTSSPNFPSKKNIPHLQWLRWMVAKPWHMIWAMMHHWWAATAIMDPSSLEKMREPLRCWRMVMLCLCHSVYGEHSWYRRCCYCSKLYWVFVGWCCCRESCHPWIVFCEFRNQF